MMTIELIGGPLDGERHEGPGNPEAITFTRRGIRHCYDVLGDVALFVRTEVVAVDLE